MKLDNLQETLKSFNQPSFFINQNVSFEHWSKWFQDNISSDITIPNIFSNENFSTLQSILKKLTVHLESSMKESNKKAIQTAAEAGYNKLLDTLLKESPDAINEPLPNNGSTPLYLACAKGHVETTRLLLENKANATCSNINKLLPIHAALFLPTLYSPDLKINKTTIFLLLKAYCKDTLTLLTNENDSIFHLIALNGFVSLLPDLIKEYPSLINAVNNQLIPPVYIAISSNQPEIVKILLGIPSVVTFCDEKGQGVLHYAAQYGNADMITLCLNVDGGLLERTDNDGATPLLIAAQYNNLDTFKALMNRDAYLEATDLSGKNALHLAVENNADEIISWLLENAPSLNEMKDHNNHVPFEGRDQQRYR